MSGVRVEPQGGEVTLLTLDRPERLNALDGELLSALEQALVDPPGRVLVLTGAGRAFCSGADLKARAAMTLEQWRGHHEQVRRAFSALRGCPLPTLAAVEGFALAGGLELALACDLIVAARDAELGLPEVTRGIMAGAGGTKLLPGIVGMARAKELVYTGRAIDGETAAAWGLVARLADPGAALAVALELAAQIAANAPLAVRAAKHSLDGGDELEAYWSCMGSDDQQEGIRAFVEKREPRFRGS